MGIILGRDAFLVGGAFVVRAQAVGWRWPGAAEFFRLQPPAAAAAPSSGSGSSGEGAAAAAEGAAAAPPAPLVQPLYISKVNTVLQLALVGACMLDAWVGWPGQGGVWAAGGAATVTTLWSCVAYLRAFRSGRLLTAGATSAER